MQSERDREKDEITWRQRALGVSVWLGGGGGREMS